MVIDKEHHTHIRMLSRIRMIQDTMLHRDDTSPCEQETHYALLEVESHIRDLFSHLFSKEVRKSLLKGLVEARRSLKRALHYFAGSIDRLTYLYFIQEAFQALNTHFLASQQLFGPLGMPNTNLHKE